MKRVLLLMLSAALLNAAGNGEEWEYLMFTTAQEYTTYCGTSVGGCVSGGEQDGKAVYYSVLAEPVRGSLMLSEDGAFVYTPREGKQGRDSFLFQTVDAQGQVSEKKMVSIRILRQRGSVHYEDLQGRPEAYAATLLSEKDLFTGERLAGRYCFGPEKPVTRGEFLAICMSISGEPVLRAAQHTGYDDDEAIPVWLKAYVVTAALQGVETAQGLDFEPDSPITKAAAAAMLAQTLGLASVPASDPEEPLNRAEMAMLLEPFLTA